MLFVFLTLKVDFQVKERQGFPAACLPSRLWVWIKATHT